EESDIEVVEYQDPSWPSTVAYWLKVVPYGMRKILVWIKDKYGNLPVLIAENGYPDSGGLDDYKRADYYKSYMFEVLKAMYEHGCNVVGYTAWSLLDNFEWTSGYV